MATKQSSVDVSAASPRLRSLVTRVSRVAAVVASGVMAACARAPAASPPRVAAAASPERDATYEADRAAAEAEIDAARVALAHGWTPPWVDREQIHRARTELARQQLVEENDAKLRMEEAEDLAVQLERELEEQTMKSRSGH